MPLNSGYFGNFNAANQYIILIFISKIMSYQYQQRGANSAQNQPQRQQGQQNQHAHQQGQTSSNFENDAIA